MREREDPVEHGGGGKKESSIQFLRYIGSSIRIDFDWGCSHGGLLFGV